jgi:hypothetical protein
VSGTWIPGWTAGPPSPKNGVEVGLCAVAARTAVVVTAVVVIFCLPLVVQVAVDLGDGIKVRAWNMRGR